MLDFTQLKIGESSTEIELDSKDNHYAATVAILSQASRSINLFSHDLDTNILNTREIMDLFKRLAIKDRHSYVKIIIHDSRKLISNGHHLVELSRQLSSHIEIRKTPKELIDHPKTFLIVDETALVYRNNSDRYEGFVNFNDRQKCRHLMEFFKHTWEKSTADPELKRLHI